MNRAKTPVKDKYGTRYSETPGPTQYNTGSGFKQTRPSSSTVKMRAPVNNMAGGRNPFGSNREFNYEGILKQNKGGRSTTNITPVKMFDTQKKKAPKIAQIKDMTREEKLQLLSELQNQLYGEPELPKLHEQSRSPIRSSRVSRPGTALKGRPDVFTPSKSVVSLRSKTPTKLTARKTVGTNANTPVKKSKTVKLAPEERGQALINPEDKLDAFQVDEYLQQAIEAADKIKNPVDDIDKIFSKITAWRKTFGDKEQQERGVCKALKTPAHIQVHNIKTIQNQLRSLQGVIGFSEDEILLIIFTSLNFPKMNNLIVLSSEFLKWFNINFEGESRDETDFKDNKIELWYAAVTLGKRYRAAFSKLQDGHGIALSKKWWDSVRFAEIGEAIAKAFSSNADVKTRLRATFKENNDKLSYYDLFQFLEKDLKLKLKNWEEDALEARLDSLSMAFIEFNEFNEFTMEFGVDWGEPLLENDLEEQLEAKLNTSYLDYKLTKADYFNGCKTILLSEKAALARANRLYQKFLAQTENQHNAPKFVDNDFGPKRRSDEAGCKAAMYKGGEPPRKGYAEAKEVEWVFAESLCDEGEVPQFVDDGVASSDCIQGNLGDCWLISALSVLATRDELIRGGRKGMEYDRNMIVDKEIAQILSSGVYPPIFHRFRHVGLYVLRFFKNYQWIYVIIDERIPINLKTRQPVFGHCIDPHELWVALIEKAYAKLHGCYENLISGHVNEGIQDMTGLQPEKIFIKDEKTGKLSKTIIHHYGGSDGFWKFLVNRKHDNCLMGCSIAGNGKSGPQMAEGRATGLILNHAYGITDVIELAGASSEEAVRILRLRNPWGKSEWLGSWSSNSEEIQKYKAQIQSYIASLPPDEKFDIDADDGTFFIDFEDWKDNFTTLFLNIDFPEDWSGVRFQSKWTSANSGGLPKQYVEDQLEEYAHNPQFLLKPTTDTEVVFSLGQPDGRLPREGAYHEYPFTQVMNNTCLAIFEVSEGTTHLQAFDKDKLVYITPIKRERENNGRLSLKANTSYILVASTEFKSKTGDLFLSIYFNCPLRDMLLKRIFHPADSRKGKEEVLPQLIPEEAEKLAYATPNWKVSLVKESLQWMITDEDQGV